MMTLAEKIAGIYPELNGTNFIKIGIIVQNNSDGKGDYIAKWEHPTLARPTDEELA
jgi:hypothetical protein